jgi:peptidoglycan lytic transglycosylase
MIHAARNFAAVTTLAALAAGCATGPDENSVTVPPNAGVYKVGVPYQIGGTWYYPSEQPDYDETGIASWYGPTFYGHATANGERFDAGALTAAHRTLPMPVNVRVTNLDNGKSLIVRVNDRGPFAKGRIIDLSERAAMLLGYKAQGTARVRVTFVSRADLKEGMPPLNEEPPEVASAIRSAPTDRVASGDLEPVPGTTSAPPIPAAQLPAAPVRSADLAAATQPTGIVTTVPVPAATHLYVQAGAFTSYTNALRLQAKLRGAVQISTVVQNGQALYRLRAGPFDEISDADQALARLTGLGSNDARIVVDQ